MGKIWREKVKSDDFEEKSKYIQEKYNLNRLVANCLAGKGLESDKDIETFLNPKRTSFLDPFDMPDMKKAVKRIIKAIETKERIIVYGDYDVDGITSSTILKRFFHDIGTDIDIYIPNRLSEGYGLNEDAIRKIANDGYNLIITVDCGITGNKEVALASELGIDTIVTDHHEPGDEIPNAVAVVDCKRKDNTYSFRDLAGCGVAFKLTQALSQKLDLDENMSLKYLDLACIGTISDIVPLVGENRTIAKLGLMLVKQLRNLGIREIVKTAGLKTLDETAISFGISPRINACGRMGHQEEALELFLTDDPTKARKLAQSLEAYNRQRQEIEKRTYSEALELAEKEKDNPCILLAKENWHHGIIGIVSSKITEDYYKPSILICIEGKDAKGSGRSVEGFDLHEAILKCGDKLTACGGHSMAIGLSLKSDNFEDFKKEFLEYANEHITDEMKEPVIEIDDEVTSKDVSIENIKQISLIKPFGESNFNPMIIYRNLKINSIRTLTEGKHIKLSLQDENITIDAIGFGLGKFAQEYQIDDRIDVVGNIGINIFNNKETIQIIIKDMRKAVR